jgi:hypothetical protein
MFAFELKLLRELGLEPDPEQTHLTPGTLRILQNLLDNDWPAIDQLRLAPAQVEELKQFLHGFLIFHLGRLPSGRSGALDIA